MDQSIRLRRPDEKLSDEFSQWATRKLSTITESNANRSSGSHQLRGEATAATGNGSQVSFTLSDGTLP